MQLDNLTISSLRDAIKDNTSYIRKLREEVHVANLLKLLEYDFITRNDILNDTVYLEYKENYNLNSKVKKKSL